MWPLLALSLILAPPAEYTAAVSISVSATGAVVVADAGANEIRAGDRRAGIGAFGRPADVDASNELTIHVADPDGRRIVLLDRHLQPVSELVSGTHRFDRIAVNRYRELYALDTAGRTLRKYRPNGETDATFTPPSIRNADASDIAVSGDAVLLSQGDVMYILNRFGLETGFRRFPAAVRRVAGIPDGALVLAGDTVFVLDAAWKTVAEVSIPAGCVDLALQDGQLLLLFPRTTLKKALH